MLRHLLVLPDGTEIFSGASGAAVMAVSLTREVNAGTLLAPGAACAAMLQLTVLSPQSPIRAGDALRLYTVNGDRTLVGIFLAQEPVRSGSLQKITAYDRLILLDREVTGFLHTLTGWPYSLLQLAKLVCEHCGLILINEEFPNAGHPVSCPTGDGITGRQLLSWIAQAAGCFCRATPEGAVELAWYTPAAIQAAPECLSCLGGVLTLTGELSDGTLTLSGEVSDGVLTLLPRQYALSGGLKLETAPTAPIDRVQLRQTDRDVGVLYPDEPGENTLVIQGNPLLAAENAENLLPVAQTLYERFAGLSYTPGTLKLPTTPTLDAGQLLTVTDTEGKLHRLYVMRLQRDASGDTVTCTGSYSRESATVVNNRSYENLHGKVLQLRTDVEGIYAENSDSRGKIASLALDMEGIRGRISAQEGELSRLTNLEQTADALKVSVESLQTQGATKIKTAMGYTFDDNGLQIARSGQQMRNLLDNTGMKVTRSGQAILQADAQGVTARDVTVGNYLIVGSHARFEDYTAGRTACFWLEG